MSLPGRLLVHMVTKVRPAASTDGYGDQALDYGAGATRTTLQARLQQDARTEAHDALRDATDQTWTLFANDTDVLATDRFEWTSPTGAMVFEVAGPPEPVYDSGAQAHHSEVTLRVRRG